MDDPTMPARPPLGALKAIEQIRGFRSCEPVEMYRAICDALQEPHEYPPEPPFDRQAGRCFLPNGEDIAELLIGRGVCGRCACYDPFRRYAEAEANAGPYRGEVPGYCMGLW